MIRSFAFRKSLMGCIVGMLALYCAQALSDWRASLPGARLVGQADFTWYGFEVYQARLWSAALRPGLETTFALELDYRRSINKQTLVETSLDEMQRIIGAPLEAGRLDAWRGHMNRAFVDVKPGSRITGVFLPGWGCRFYVNEQLSHVVADPAFAQAFFAIWLDPDTRDKKSRNQLLGVNTSRNTGDKP
ncbi:chalcone isomerase family protein [Pseudomonas sp. G2-4]|uniref:chalcone isomerase family protein n=1 Tax=Pseudomonas sp. G2-4 TaxID=1506334 RepID=UPI0024B893F6|nr:chalcone isomerase family protein [Pseudomonas sp. G2-4]WHS62840.1 chalcone isomerase family protein [Pseudomonas sp. G2-4]